MPPPSAGGIAVLQILGILERLPRTDYPRDPVAAVHFFAEAGRLAYADRDRYVADPDFVDVPVAGLIAPDYLAARAALIAPDRSLRRAPAGHPRGAPTAAYDRAALELEATTHFSVVDAEGNAVASTSSIEAMFGNRRFVRGFLLNNQLTDFAFLPEADGAPVANRVEGGKRPRSSMSPTMVFDADGAARPRRRLARRARDHQLRGAGGGRRARLGNGSAGGARRAALRQPQRADRGRGRHVRGPAPGRPGGARPRRAGQEMTSGVHAIRRVGEQWIGAADPRREGIARGE